MQKRRPGRWPTRAGVGLICRNEDAARKWEPAGPEKRGRRRWSRTSDGGAHAGGGGENGTETEVRVSGRSRVGGSGHPAVDDYLGKEEFEVSAESPGSHIQRRVQNPFIPHVGLNSDPLGGEDTGPSSCRPGAGRLRYPDR